MHKNILYSYFCIFHRGEYMLLLFFLSFWRTAINNIFRKNYHIPYGHVIILHEDIVRTLILTKANSISRYHHLTRVCHFRPKRIAISTKFTRHLQTHYPNTCFPSFSSFHACMRAHTQFLKLIKVLPSLL